MASAMYWRTSLTGGNSGSLDNLNADRLNDMDSAIVVTASNCYIYSLDDDSGAAESSPNTIKPDNDDDGAYAGAKRWIKVTV